MLLMHKDIPVAVIDEHCNRVYKILNAKRYPIGAGINAYTDDDRSHAFRGWLSHRNIPFFRQDKAKIENILHMSVDEAAIRALQVSLTDCYWIKPEDSPLTWNAVNYYDNDIDSTFGDIYLFNKEKELDRYNYPDFTTNGVQPKVWLQTNNVAYLYKEGFDREYGDTCSANEYAAYLIAKRCHIPCADYMPIKRTETEVHIGTVNVLRDSNHELISVDNIMLDEHIYDGADIYYKIRELGFEKEQNDMIWFDYLVHNSDRHPGNIFLIRNAETLEFESFSPLIDHGCCLASEPYDKDKTYYGFAKPYAETFDEQLNFLPANYKNGLPPLSDIKDAINRAYNIYSIPEEVKIHSMMLIEKSYKKLKDREQLPIKDQEYDR